MAHSISQFNSLLPLSYSFHCWFQGWDSGQALQAKLIDLKMYKAIIHVNIEWRNLMGPLLPSRQKNMGN